MCATRIAAVVRFAIRPRRGRPAAVALVVAWALLLAPAAGVTVIIGDVDGFGFGDSTALRGPRSATDVTGDGIPDADTDQDGILTPGEYLPDLDADGYVHVTGHDEFDNRAAAEAADLYAKWTDVSLEENWAGAPGHPNDALFIFTFTPPQQGAADYGVDHFVNIVAGDFDTGSLTVNIDGTTFPLEDVGNEDGQVTLTNATVPWANMVDGEVVVNIQTPGEPYTAFDYVLLDRQVSEAPELATTPDDGGTLDVGLARVGTAADADVLVANLGGTGSVLTGSAGSPSGAPFSGPAGSAAFTLNPGEDRSFTYTFAPTTRGAFNDAFTVSSNDPADTDGHDVSLAGQGVGPVLGPDVSAGSLFDFGPLDDGDSALLAVLALQNLSDDGDLGALTDLTIHDILLAGPDAALFEVVGFSPGTVLPADGTSTCAVSIRFNAAGPLGVKTAALTIRTDEGAPLGADGTDLRYDLAGEVVPEPLTLSLLALGGWGLLRRRGHR